MEFKKFLLVLGITIMVTLGVVFGITYAWYAYSNAEVSVSGKTSKNAPTVIFANTEYIVTNQLMPILDEDRYKYAKKNTFSITFDENFEGYEIGIEIILTDINISNELKNVNFKYELLKDGKTISTGDFSELNGTSMSLMPMAVLDNKVYPCTYNYELYIWLSDDKSNQNDLMNKTFSAKVDVKSAIKGK